MTFSSSVTPVSLVCPLRVPLIRVTQVRVGVTPVTPVYTYGYTGHGVTPQTTDTDTLSHSTQCRTTMGRQ
ncbi:hypothetical protein BN000_02201 [Mycobacterium europaeum]|uniref:Uncharacterized protein n=1 Tax=Mycobacterium europaeum TaxID=761804 RepID=A0A0U1D9E5_9MYCO|nr:hypothetical protein BN000_02201 [Mycobacterium europaeum]